MSIRQLDVGTSFLLTFEAIATHAADVPLAEPFRLLLNPHQTQQTPAFSVPGRFGTPVSDKFDVDADPVADDEGNEDDDALAADAIVISHASAAFCDEDTLRRCQLANPHVILLAAPEAAKVIRRWKSLDTRNMQVLRRWEDPRLCGTGMDVRISLPGAGGGGGCGEVTISYITSRHDSKGQHAAVGITYRPPPERNPASVSRLLLQTPPATPNQTVRMSSFLPHIPATLPGLSASPSLRSARSATSLMPHLVNRAVSVVYAPNGIPFPALKGYATSHLLNVAALPLTALLHCFDRVEVPWWMGTGSSSGNNLGSRTGATTGAEIASALGARLWLDVPQPAFTSASAGSGGGSRFGALRRGLTKRTTYSVQDVRRRIELESRSGGKRPGYVAAVRSLRADEDIVLTGEGIWQDGGDASSISYKKSTELSLYGVRPVFNDMSSEPFPPPPPPPALL